MLDKLIIISFTIGLIIVGGLAVFSIYLQLDESAMPINLQIDESVIPIKEIMVPEKTCLERWDYLKLVNKETSDNRLIADSQELNMEFFITTGCADSFRDWMPELDSSWQSFVEWEINKESKCELYLKGDLQMNDWFEPIMREMGCEDLLKK